MVLDVLTGGRCVGRTIYAVTLLTGNFCILDVVQTLRVAQLKAENRIKSSSVVRVDVMNQALHTQALEAEAEARLSRRFLANISHELRTPLNSVIAFNTLVVEDGDSPCSDSSHVEYCAAALTAAEALLGIINQVLDYTQLENEMQLSSKLELDNDLFSLRDVLDELLDIVGSRVNIRKVDFTMDVDLTLLGNEGKDVLFGDSFRLRQCLTNLCDNAIKFSKDVGGEVVVKVFFEKRDFELGPETMDLVVEVIDNGVGIDPEKHFLLFKPFSQVNSSMARTAHGGTGLGLAITKSIVESMRGTVKCISDGNGNGSTFRMVVPVEVASPKEARGFIRNETLENAKDMQIRLAMIKAPSTEKLLQMLELWGIPAKNVTDLNFSGLIPSGKELDLVLSKLKADSDKGDNAVWIMDSSVIIAMLNRESRDEASMQLSKVKCIVAGHFDEQALLRKGLGVVGQDTLANWQTITRPLKHSLLLAKLKKPSASTADGASPVKMTLPKWMNSGSQRKLLVDAQQSAEPDSTKTRILLVDDHVVNQKVALRMIQKILGANNVEVHVANDGFEAINMVKNNTLIKGLYDVILMDVQMPGCDGLEATTKIREWEASNKTQRQFICALTAHANKSDVQHCLDSGMDKYMSKPLNLEDFREMLLTDIPSRGSRGGKA
jgi:signal transduction histidine kinase/ActR/RegA family two-component response regulator